jgi:hypothetical protein
VSTRAIAAGAWIVASTRRIPEHFGQTSAWMPNWLEIGQQDGAGAFRVVRDRSLKRHRPWLPGDAVVALRGVVSARLPLYVPSWYLCFAPYWSCSPLPLPPKLAA